MAIIGKEEEGMVKDSEEGWRVKEVEIDGIRRWQNIIDMYQNALYKSRKEDKSINHISYSYSNACRQSRVEQKNK